MNNSVQRQLSLLEFVVRNDDLEHLVVTCFVDGKLAKDQQQETHTYASRGFIANETVTTITETGCIYYIVCISIHVTLTRQHLMMKYKEALALGYLYQSKLYDFHFY